MHVAPSFVIVLVLRKVLLAASEPPGVSARLGGSSGPRPVASAVGICNITCVLRHRQPGIGKSLWIIYALCRHLTEGEPFIWYRGTRRYLFVAEGVFMVPLDHLPTDFKTHIWTFINADDTSDPCIDEMYYQYGPTPRICFDFLCNEALLFAHEARYESALGKLSLQKLGYMASKKVNSGMDDESHTLVLVTRLLVDGDGDGKFSHSRLEPVTRMIKLKLQNKLRKETLANVEGTRRIAGIVYESLAQDMLEEKIALKLVPMVKRELGKSGRRLKFPRWLSDHGGGANLSLVRPIDIMPVKMFVYTASGLDHPIENMVYYALEAQNQVAFDSFIMAEGKLYIFQFTIGSDHSMKEEIVRFFFKKGPGSAAKGGLAFCDDDFKELLNEMNLFSVVLDCEA
ncbi:hypothetical protein EDB89DRAFT_1910472 [Lactarius sanguifluus]|nr:hypothetical protein EDB89DRAFT_1910472 [Lactarius sanguifluus]